nr:hypothetical protein [Candidatus Sigynarchaeota archaeon]
MTQAQPTSNLPTPIVKPLHLTSKCDICGQVFKARVSSAEHSGWQPFIMGVAMEALGTLVGDGGIIRVILHFAGITVPILV